MASPPFVISSITPGDSDIVSQFPLNERTMRDIVQSWLLIDHDTNGDHVKLTMPYQSSTPATPAASLVVFYADATGRIKAVYPDGSVSYIGLPPGTVIYTASSTTPVGFLVADGSAVSRSTYADLFAQIASIHGNGNGSTTFNLPDIRGRAIAGEDSSASRLTSTYFGTTAVIGAVGGTEFIVLDTTMIPSHTHTGTTGNESQDHTHIYSQPIFSSSQTGGGSFPEDSAVQNNNTGGQSNHHNHPFTTNATGGGLGHSSVQHTIVLRALIKT